MSRAVETFRSGEADGVSLHQGSVASGRERLVSLDALRGVAISLVIIHHTWFRLPEAQDSWLARSVASIGWAGVDLFFAISGFLITTILLRTTEGESLWPFYIKRFFRIIPIYVIAVALYFALALVLGHESAILHRIWINFALLTAWAIPFLGEHGVPYTITWSVSVEEFAYILLGLGLLAGRKHFFTGLWLIVLLALLVRVLSIAWFSVEPITLYYFAPGRIDSIAMGGVMAALHPHTIRRLSVPIMVPWLTWIGVIAACAIVKRESVVVATFGYTAIACSSAWLVLCVASRQVASPWRLTRNLASFGLVSYFIYLFHGFVLGAIALLVPSKVAAAIGVFPIAIVVALATYLLAMASWRLFEYPLILRGRRLAAKCETANLVDG
jgi:Predicted acyltransferases